LTHFENKQSNNKQLEDIKALNRQKNTFKVKKTMLYFVGTQAAICLTIMITHVSESF